MHVYILNRLREHPLGNILEVDAPEKGEASSRMRWHHSGWQSCRMCSIGVSNRPNVPLYPRLSFALYHHLEAFRRRRRRRRLWQVV